MKPLVLLALLLNFSLPARAAEVSLEQEVLLLSIVGTYVNGFKEFDTSLVIYSDTISVDIYYDDSTQSSERAESLARRFRATIPPLLIRKGLAEGMKVTVSVYGEDRTGRGY